MEKYNKSMSLLLVVIIVFVRSGEGKLSENFYKSSCPNVESIVRQAVAKKVNQTFFTIPATLRLFFHDCFVEGCDASILLISLTNDGERDAPDSLTLAGDGYDTVLQAKKAVEAVCPGKVSCADILTIATRDVVSLAGGPNFAVELGRRDGLVSKAASVAGNIPLPGFNLAQLNAMFAKHNLSQTDMIALSGVGHTLGFSHCNQFSNRLYSFNGTHTDPTLNSTYAAELKRICPVNGSDPDIVANLDPVTPKKFDNVYYKNLVVGKGLLSSDQVLFTDKASRPTVVGFADKEGEFDAALVAAMRRLGRVGVKIGVTGEIRRDCTAINS